MSNEVALIEELALKAANEYLNANRDLSRTIADMAVAYQLNPHQIRRVVERANRITFLKMYKGNDDKTFSFPVADIHKILATLEGVPAGMSDTAYNLKGVNLMELPVERTPTTSRFYTPADLPDPDICPEAPVAMPETETVLPPEGKIREIYVIVDGKSFRPNERAIEKLLHEIRTARAEEKTAALMSGMKLDAIKQLFEQLIRAGMSAAHIVGGVFAKLPAFLKEKAIPVVQNVVNSLFREGKLKQMVDVNQSMLKFGEYDPYFAMSQEPLGKIAEEIGVLNRYAGDYRAAMAKKAELLVELGQVRELFPDYYIDKSLEGDMDV